MPLKPAAISISDSVHSILLKFSKSKTLPARQVERAKIFLLCADGLDNLQISRNVSIGQDSVSRWYTRFLKSLPLLQDVEEKNPAQLENEITIFLADCARHGQPPTYTDEQIIKIIEIASRSPKEYGYETSHWSLNQLAAVTVRKGITESISAKNHKPFFKIRGKSVRISSVTGCILPRKRKTRKHLHRKLMKSVPYAMMQCLPARTVPISYPWMK